MKREIKFRAWDGEQMRYEFSVQPTGEILYSGDIVDWVLIQYTGLKDKNGNEIYDGDVMRDKYGYLYTVQNWEGSVFRLVLYGITWEFLYETHSRGVLRNEFEVIGNIHEHPHLLNKTA